MQIIFFGFNFIISFVRLPVPEPISITCLFLNDANERIFFDIFLSINRFCPKDFFKIHLLSLEIISIHLLRLFGLEILIFFLSLATP